MLLLLLLLQLTLEMFVTLLLALLLHQGMEVAGVKEVRLHGGEAHDMRGALAGCAGVALG